MKIAKNIRCPAGSSDCPYYACGWCQMEEETGDHPHGQCDDYDWYEEEEDYDNESSAD